MQDDVLVDIRAAAKRCGVVPKTIYNMLNRGAFPRPVRLGRSVRWRRSDLDGFIAAGCSIDEFNRRLAAQGAA